MVIMKDSSDAFRFSVGHIYRSAVNNDYNIAVTKDCSDAYLVSTEFVYSGGRLVLFFRDRIPSDFQLHEKVILRLVSLKQV